jgi:hypothetical protein
MVLHDAEAEKPFTEAIDCRFPYESDKASALIWRGWAISLNAAFCVLHELCRPPKQSSVPKERLRELVSEWATGPDHPLKEPLLEAAHALVDGAYLPWREGVEMMKRVGDYDGQGAALAIVYMASDCDRREGDDALSRTADEIGRSWNAKGV